MHDTMAVPRRFPGMRRRISLFLVFAVLGLAGAVLLVAWKQGAFVRQTSIYFYADDVIGINKGMSVRLYGLPVGNVKGFAITGRGVQVQLAINSENLPLLNRGAQARLTREGYIGAASILLVPGNDPRGSREPLGEGDVIGFITNRGVAELVDDIKNQIAPVMTELRQLLVELNRPEGGLRKTLENSSALLAQLPETNRDLRQVLKSTDKAVQAVGNRAEAALAATERVGRRVEQDLPELVRKLGTTLEGIDAAALEIRGATRRSGEALHQVLSLAPGLLRDGEQLVRDGQDVVGAAKQSWLLRDNLEPAAMRTLPLDSFEARR